MAGGAGGMPNIFGCSEVHDPYRARKSFGNFFTIIFKGNLHAMSVAGVLVNDEQRPLAVWTLHGICGYQFMFRIVLDVSGCQIQLMRSAAVFDPIEI